MLGATLPFMLLCVEGEWDVVQLEFTYRGDTPLGIVFIISRNLVSFSHLISLYINFFDV